jgi:hypothetical protein
MIFRRKLTQRSLSRKLKTQILLFGRSSLDIIMNNNKRILLVVWEKAKESESK